MNDMEIAIVEYVEAKKGNVSFVELEREIPGFTGGDKALFLEGNIFVWYDLSDPRARRKINYKEPHWLPVVINPGKKEAQLG